MSWPCLKKIYLRCDNISIEEVADRVELVSKPIRFPEDLIVQK